jgi:hypothetical protein
MNRQASVQDITWFLDLDNVKRLDLTPPYQRRSVWTASDQRFFLDTIFRNYPCPPIFIHKTIDNSGIATYHVVDGKQRLETILKFASNKLAISKDFGDERLNGKKLKDIDPELKRSFWNYSVPVDFIDLPPGLNINEIFDRVNRNSRNLERQELRHARYNGWFITEVENEIDEDKFWEDINVTSKAKSKRMKDVQFVSELLLIIVDEKIVGFDQYYIDEKYAALDNIDEVEEGLEFDKEKYYQEKNKIKKFIAAMEASNRCISTHAKTANNLYTLFAVLALEKFDVLPQELAARYMAFMEVVEEIKNLEPDDQIPPDENKKPNWDNAYKYYVNTRGASTDLFQRQERYNALKAAIL